MCWSLFHFFFLHLGSHAALFWSHQEWSISCKLVLQSWNSLGVSRFKSLFIRRCLQVDLASNSADSDPLNSTNDLCYWLSGFQSLYVCSSVCLTFCPCDYPFVCLFVFLFVCLSVVLSVCLSLRSYARLPTHLSMRPSVCLSDWQGYDMWFEVLNSAIFTDHVNHILFFFLGHWSVSLKPKQCLKRPSGKREKTLVHSKISSINTYFLHERKIFSNIYFLQALKFW